MTTLAQLANRYWTEALRYSPLTATFYGCHEYDSEIDDLSESAEGAYTTSLRSLLRELTDLTESGELPRAPHPDHVTASLLRECLTDAITIAAFGLAELRSDHMTGPHAELLQIWPQLSYPEPAQAFASLDRVARIPAMLDQALERFRAGLARGRTPAAAVIHRSISQITGYLSSDLTGDPFINPRLPAQWASNPPEAAAWSEQATRIVTDAVRPGFSRYLTVLRDELLPVARGDDRPGLCWLPDGDEIYRALVRTHTTLALEPAKLHETGIDFTERALPAEYREVGVRGLQTSDPQEIFRRLRDDPALRHASEAEIIDSARAVVLRADAALTGWFGLRHQAPCEVAPVPDFLAPDAPAAYYFPPAPDGSRPGTYFVNTSDPTSRGRYELESVAFHEAIPGHHLQIAIASELTSVPDFQRFVHTTAYAEGWGLYAERLADEMGLYSDDLQRLGMLAADSWRSGRLVVDTGLHALGWSRQRAIDYLLRQTPVTESVILPEIDRYIGMPGQALAYKVGQQEILRLRAKARATLAERFDIAAFHDVVLGSGGVPLSLLDELVSDWIVRAQQPE